MVNKELPLARADALWESMDNTGYAGRFGSDKPEMTRLVVRAHQRVCQGGEQVPNLAIEREEQFPLISMSPAERREVARIATNQRQRPNGTFRRFRAVSSFGDQINSARYPRYASWLAGRASARY
ncbi:MAG: hypothetical protein PHE48_00805 [Candidatus Daviesbacteria bacterium]|nr:hypothetical protein [Candidatus Daviesbacteria bacterium]